MQNHNRIPINPPNIADIQRKVYCQLNPNLKENPPERSIEKLSLSSLFAKPLTEPSEILSLKKLVLHALKINEKKYLGHTPNRLPGPLPIALNRRALKETLLTKDFWVSEKSDGERCFLLVREKESYLVNRSFEFYELQSKFYSEKLWNGFRCCID